VLDKLQLSRSHFYSQKRRGGLPFVEECRPRIGRMPRFRADLIDRWLSGQWPTHIRSLRRSA
jgi:hypothetical protein